jgi:hypothetical protein
VPDVPYGTYFTNCAKITFESVGQNVAVTEICWVIFNKHTMIKRKIASTAASEQKRAGELLWNVLRQHVAMQSTGPQISPPIAPEEQISQRKELVGPLESIGCCFNRRGHAEMGCLGEHRREHDNAVGLTIASTQLENKMACDGGKTMSGNSGGANMFCGCGSTNSGLSGSASASGKMPSPTLLRTVSLVPPASSLSSNGCWSFIRKFASGGVQHMQQIPSKDDSTRPQVEGLPGIPNSLSQVSSNLRSDRLAEIRHQKQVVREGSKKVDIKANLILFQHANEIQKRFVSVAIFLAFGVLYFAASAEDLAAADAFYFLSDYMSSLSQWLEPTKVMDVIFFCSGALLMSYPALLFAWTVSEGYAAGEKLPQPAKGPSATLSESGSPMPCKVSR